MLDGDAIVIMNTKSSLQDVDRSGDHCGSSRINLPYHAASRRHCDRVCVTDVLIMIARPPLRYSLPCPLRYGRVGIP